MMASEYPPWKRPAAIGVVGGGETVLDARANHWKQWGAKPEARTPEGTCANPLTLRSFGCSLANRRKRRDGKARGLRHESDRSDSATAAQLPDILCVRFCRERKIFNERLEKYD